MENEPEEGEIIDNYELISSDEELTMRQRIEELESKNKELEQIAVISRSYSNSFHYSVTDVGNYHINVHRHDYIHDQINYDNRLSHMAPDASLISSAEFIPSEPSIKYRKRKTYKKKHLRSHHHGKRTKRHHYSYNTSKRDRGKDKHFAYMANPMLSSETPSNTNSDNDSEIDRNALHLAVARYTKNSTYYTKQDDIGLRERLLRHKEKDNARNEKVMLRNLKEDVQFDTNQDDNSSDSLEEKELRLIALKSAVLKKHVKRTKRDAESAYSPTDFDEMIKSGILNNCGVDSELELDLINSPIISPKLLLSPLSDMDEVSDDKQHSTSATVISQVDTKVVDMDISNSDCDDMACDNKWCGDFGQLTSPPSPSGIATVHPIIQYDYNHSTNYSYGLNVPNLQLQPLPPEVKCYENIAPPCEILTSLPNVPKEDPSVQEMELEISELDSNLDHPLVPQFQSGIKQNDTSTYSCEEVEEEEALRTLLLAKMQSIRVKRRKSMHAKKQNQENREIDKMKKVKPNNTTEIILKEAVRRFKLHETDGVDKSQNKEISGILHESNAATLITHKQKSLHSPPKSESNIMTHIYDSPVDIIDLTNDDNDDAVEYNVKDKPFDNIKYVEELPKFETAQDILEECLKLVEENKMRSKYDSSHPPCNKFNSNQIDSLSVVPTTMSNNVDSLNEDNFITTTIENNPTTIENNPTTVEWNISIQHEYMQNRFEDDAPEVPSIILSDKEKRAILDSACTITNTKSEEKTTNADEHLISNLTKNRAYNNLIGTTDQDDIKNRTQIEQNVNVRDDDNTLNSKEQNVDTISKVQTNNESFSKTDTKSIEPSTSTNYLSLNAQSSQANIANRKTIFNKLKLLKSRNSLVKSSKTILNKVQKFTPYSTFTTQKIVKPNKVINKNIELTTNIKNNFNKMEKSSAVSVKTVKSNLTDPPQCSVHSSEKGKVLVQRLVIDLQDLSTDSLESINEDASPLCDKYNDNVSPISLNIENSSHENLLRSDSPNEQYTNSDKKSQHQHFEKKLETFLQSIRSKVNEDEENTSAKDSMVYHNAPTTSVCNSISTIANCTPVAVRHLPVAAQEEYRLLVHRMKMLENQRKHQKDSSKNLETIDPIEVSSTTINGKTINKSICKSVLVKDTTKNTSGLEQSVCKPTNNNDLLNSYEKQFRKICTDITNNLDKSLRLVADAKQHKMKKLSLERRMKMLKEELNTVQRQYVDEQEKIKRVLPIVRTVNDTVLTLKKKHAQIAKTTVNLGKTLKGDDYRLPNELNLNITQKTEELSKEIKVVNSLTTDDITDDYIAGINGKKSLEKVDSTKTINNEYNSVKAANTNHMEQDTMATKVLGMQSSTEQLPVEGSSELQNNNDGIQCLNEHNTTITDHSNNDNQTQATILGSNAKEAKHENVTHEYQSPLKYFQKPIKITNAQGILCPYKLMGDCEDINCSYVHLTE